MLTRVTRHLRRTARRHGEGGQALIFVLIAVALLGTIPIAIATTTVDQLPQTTRNLNYEAAYEAAQAGLNDYLQHLDANEGYALCTASSPSSSCTSNSALTGWVQASSSPLEYYSYTPSDTNGQVTLQVSGKAGTGNTVVVRTFSYNIDPASSLDDVYWSNYETLDPALGGTGCSVYYGQGSGPPNSCVVVFTTGDVLNGPVFSDDTFRMCGSPTFDDSVESGNIYNTNSGPSAVYVASSGCGSLSPNFNGGTPTKVGNQTPRTSTDDLAPARNYGCFITGGTAPNSLSTVTVTLTLSVVSGHTQVTWSGSGAKVDNATSNTSNCTSPINLNNLTQGLIFVNGTVKISGSMTGALDIVTCGTSTDDSTKSTACTSSDPSTNPSNIDVTGNLTYPSANKTMVSGQPVSDSSDVLGLVASNFVEVTTTSNVEIDAAILALGDSFYVNNWNGGASYGTLSVFGSIAQDYRGPVGLTNGAGYTKNYNYDNSLQTVFPPFFIPPNGATWTPSSYEECGSGLSHSVLNTPQC
ncbi:MAG TPA: hypothetical protein VLZ77_08370 [Acidimicrobiales bacterium]|nr:hypothetical protein [Acidimicrobiales bacterium]